MPGIMEIVAAAPEPGVNKVAWAGALLAWLLAVPAYFVFGLIDTIAHEGGHALLAKLLFQRVKAIRLFSDGGGVTYFDGDMPWVVDVAVKFVGYVAPSLFGLAAAWLLDRGHVDGTLWASLGFLLLMLFAVRGLLGWLVVPTLMIVICYVALAVEPPIRELFAYVWTWFLLIAAVETMLIFLRGRGYDNSGSDAGALRRLTRLSGEFWAVLMLIGTTAALVYGGVMLLRVEA
ncbi:M50 family metallopeptidase [Catenuloplanes japonicus]|uniref:M50 family metallopeptidase n=1 Tax=Catenuloplanes japonicus TaxID=33876 RepID=UPI00068A3CCB|nr:M50 family metallopeptidase [Catenuloplanes japonicus]